MIEIAYHSIANHANHATTPSRPPRLPRLPCFPCPWRPSRPFGGFLLSTMHFPFTAQWVLAISPSLHNVRLLEEFIKWVNDCDCERKDQRYFERKLANQITFSNVICDCDLAQKKWLWITSGGHPMGWLSIHKKVMPILSSVLVLIGFSWPCVSWSTSGTSLRSRGGTLGMSPRLIPPHLVGNPYPNSPPSSIVTLHMLKV